MSSIRIPHLLIAVAVMYVFIMLCLVTLVDKFPITQSLSLSVSDAKESSCVPLRHVLNITQTTLTTNDSRLHLKQRNVIRTNTTNSTAKLVPHDMHAAHVLVSDTTPKLLSCAEISNLTIDRFLNKGFTKAVYKSTYQGKSVVVKMISAETEDIKACLRRGKYWHRNECFLLANYKLMKETMLSLQLDHPNILKTLGYCVRSDLVTSSLQDHGTVLVKEFGSKINSSDIKMYSWNQKIQHAIQLTDLMDYLEHSPLGSLAILDFKMSQFIRVDQTIKLGDLDDLTADKEPKCNQTSDCVIIGNHKTTATVNCNANRCHGYHAKSNLIKLMKVFLNLFLKKPPKDLQTAVNDIFAKIPRTDFDAKSTSAALSALFRFNATRELNNKFVPM